MAPSLVAVLSDVRFNNGVMRGHLDEWEDCVYADSDDETEPAEVTVLASSPKLPLLAIGAVLLVQNESGGIYEYRIARLEDDVRLPKVRVVAAPIAHDLDRVHVSMVPMLGGPRTMFISNTLTPGQWYDTYIAPSLAAAGMPYFGKGTFAVTETLTLEFEDQSVMWLLQQLVENSTATVWVERDVASALWKIHLAPRTATSSPRAFVGDNVEALKREIQTEYQATEVRVVGIQGESDADRAVISDVPWRVSAQSGGTVDLVDPRDLTGDFIIEDDQVRGLKLLTMTPQISGVQPNIPVTGIGGERAYGTPMVWVPSNGYLYVCEGSGVSVVSIWNPATGLQVGTDITVGIDARAIGYAPTSGMLFVANYGGASVSVINVSTSAVVATVGLGGGVNPVAVMHHAGTDRMIVLCEGTSNLYIIHPSTYALTGPYTGGSLSLPRTMIYVSHQDEFWIGSVATGQITRFNPNTLAFSTIAVHTNSGATYALRMAYLPLHNIVAVVRAKAGEPCRVDYFNGSGTAYSLAVLAWPGAPVATGAPWSEPSLVIPSGDQLGLLMFFYAQTAIGLIAQRIDVTAGGIVTDETMSRPTIVTSRFWPTTVGLPPSVWAEEGDFSGYGYLSAVGVGAVYPFDSEALLVGGIMDTVVGAALATQRVTLMRSTRAAKFAVKQRAMFTRSMTESLDSLESPSRIGDLLSIAGNKVSNVWSAWTGSAGVPRITPAVRRGAGYQMALFWKSASVTDPQIGSPTMSATFATTGTKVAAVVVRKGPVHASGNPARVELYDTTAAASRGTCTFNFDAGGLLTATPAGGAVLISSLALGDGAYLVWLRWASCTAGNSHALRWRVTHGSATAIGSIYVGPMVLLDSDTPVSVPTAYGRRQTAIETDRYRWESNLVLGGEHRNWVSAAVHDYIVPTPSAGSPFAEIRWHTPPTSGIVNTAVSDGANGPYTATPNQKAINLRGFAAGAIITPGTMLRTGSSNAVVIQRSIANGSGQVTLTIMSDWTVTLADGASVSVKGADTSIGVTPFAGVANGCPVLIQPISASPYTNLLDYEVDVPQRFPLVAYPYLHMAVTVVAISYAGSSPTNWIPVGSINWSLRWGTSIVDAGGASPGNATLDTTGTRIVLNDVFPLQWPGKYTLRLTSKLAQSHNAVNGFVQTYVEQVAMWFSSSALWDGVPLVNLDVGHGLNLWGLTNIALLDRRDPLIAYTVRPRENDPTNPWLVGATAILRDPQRGIAASPMVRAWRRRLSPPNLSVPNQPEVELDNRPDSLMRRLAAAGVL